MKNPIQVLYITALSLSLSACQVNPGNIGLGFGLGGGSGGGLHFGTGINIPISVLGVGNASHSGIKVQEEQVVSYFNHAANHYQAHTKPIRGGFYRKLLGKQGSQWLVQDFYYDTGRKYNEPMLLNQAQAYQFDSLPPSGIFYTYHENGQLASKREYANQRLISAQAWNVNGQVLR